MVKFYFKKKDDSHGSLYLTRQLSGIGFGYDWKWTTSRSTLFEWKDVYPSGDYSGGNGGNAKKVLVYGDKLIALHTEDALDAAGSTTTAFDVEEVDLGSDDVQNILFGSDNEYLGYVNGTSSMSFERNGAQIDKGVFLGQDLTSIQLGTEKQGECSTTNTDCGFFKYCDTATSGSTGNCEYNYVTITISTLIVVLIVSALLYRRSKG